jgi:hypothetical protein
MNDRNLKALEELRADRAFVFNNRGKFAVIGDGKLRMVLDTYADGIQVGYDQFGVNAFLCQQIPDGLYLRSA